MDSRSKKLVILIPRYFWVFLVSAVLSAHAEKFSVSFFSTNWLTGPIRSSSRNVRGYADINIYMSLFHVNFFHHNIAGYGPLQSSHQ